MSGFCWNSDCPVHAPAPTVPDNAGLREALFEELSRDHTGPRAEVLSGRLAALPEVAALLAERDKAVGQVERVRELVRHSYTETRAIRRALGDLS